MRISHKVAYALQVTTTLSRIADTDPTRAVPGYTLAQTDDLPPGFLQDILRLLRNGHIVQSKRGGDGGWLLARSSSSITVADVIRAVDGPLASVRGLRPHELASGGEEEAFVMLWIAVRAALRSVLETVTLADLAAGTLPDAVVALALAPDAWDDHSPRPARVATDRATRPAPRSARRRRPP